MESNMSNESSEQVQAQFELWNLLIGYLKSMSLTCAIDLGIPHIINNHGKPMTLSQLQSTLSLPSARKPHLRRLLRMLTHMGFFQEQGVGIGTEAVYGLAPLSRLVLKNEGLFCLFPVLRFHLDSILVKPSLHMSDWFKQGDQPNPFEAAYDCTFWEMMSKDPEQNKMFNVALEEKNSYFINAFIKNAGDVFKGVNSLVDVGGGNGGLAKGIAQNFPHIECTVLDLPHVIGDIPNDGPVKFVSGDMFNYIPSADVVALKIVQNDWCDEDCVKILKRCKEAIPSREAGGKVIVLELVVGLASSEIFHESQVLTDMLLMTAYRGGERDEEEWRKLFTDAGFGSFQITHTIGPYSMMVLYP